MTRFGYTLMPEQSGPRDLVSYAAAAEQVGFDFEVCSDHYPPWLMSHGHVPYAWGVPVEGRFILGLGSSGRTSTSTSPVKAGRPSLSGRTC